MDGYFEGQALPGQLTARNITITLRTVVRGLSYLLTFLFAANTVGLAGESPIQALHLLQEGETMLLKFAEGDHGSCLHVYHLKSFPSLSC